MNKWIYRGLMVIVGVVIVVVVYQFIAPSRYSDKVTYSSSGQGSAGESYGLTGIATDLSLPAVSGDYGEAGLYETIVNRDISAPDLSVSDRKVKTSATLDLLVSDADATAEEIDKVAIEQTGLVIEKNIRQDSNGVRFGWLVISVPQDKFAVTVDVLKSMALEVQSEVIAKDDITEVYIDTQARINNMRAEEQSYERLLEKSVSVDQTLKIVRQLSEIRAQIESVEKQLQQMDNKVAYSNISVNLTAEKQAEVLGVRWRPLVNAKIAIQDMLESLSKTTDILVRFVVFLPVILIWGLFFFAVGYVGAKALKWLKRKNDAMKEHDKNGDTTH